MADTFQWTRDGVDISGATSSTYTLTAADDGKAIRARVILDGGPTATSQPVTVGAPAVSAAGVLVDQSFTRNSGVQTYDTSGDFTGDNITYSLVTSLTGVTIDAGTAVVSFDTGVLAVQEDTTITVRATNSGGFADSSFLLDITAVGETLAPVDEGGLSLSGETASVIFIEADSFPVDFIGGLWPVGSDITDGAVVVAGTGADDTFEVLDQSVLDEPILSSDVMPTPTADKEFYVVARDDNGNVSDPVMILIPGTATGTVLVSGSSQITVQQLQTLTTLTASAGDTEINIT